MCPAYRNILLLPMDIMGRFFYIITVILEHTNKIWYNKNKDFPKQGGNRMDTVNRISCLDFENARIKECRMYNGLILRGEFRSADSSGHRFFSLHLIRLQGDLSDFENDIVCGTIHKLAVNKSGTRYEVIIELTADMGGTLSRKAARFECEGINGPWLTKYEGFSYKNVFGTKEYEEYLEPYKYVFDDRYMGDISAVSLPDGYSAAITPYCHRIQKDKQYMQSITMSRTSLIKNDRVIFDLERSDSNIPFDKLIIHSSGHRYYPFKMSLYGMSFCDIDSGEIYHYIPQGYDNTYGAPHGESFIICDMHYDKASDLIAYEGCYWAHYYDVMAGDLSEVIPYSPYLVSIHKLIDPEYEVYYDIDFVRWDNDALIVNAESDQGTEELAVSISQIRNSIKELKMKAEENNYVVRE